MPSINQFISITQLDVSSFYKKKDEEEDGLDWDVSRRLKQQWVDSIDIKPGRRRRGRGGAQFSRTANTKGGRKEGGGMMKLGAMAEARNNGAREREGVKGREREGRRKSLIFCALHLA